MIYRGLYAVSVVINSHLLYTYGLVWHVVVYFSSQNAKKWEVELQTLKNNNARLTTALQESAVNVEEWKVQLSNYKEANVTLKKKVILL